jgi:hypothetical protein
MFSSFKHQKCLRILQRNFIYFLILSLLGVRKILGISFHSSDGRSNFIHNDFNFYVKYICEKQIGDLIQQQPSFQSSSLVQTSPSNNISSTRKSSFIPNFGGSFAQPKQTTNAPVVVSQSFMQTPTQVIAPVLPPIPRIVEIKSIYECVNPKLNTPPNVFAASHSKYEYLNNTYIQPFLKEGVQSESLLDLDSDFTSTQKVAYPLCPQIFASIKNFMLMIMNLRNENAVLTDIMKGMYVNKPDFHNSNFNLL